MKKLRPRKFVTQFSVTHHLPFPQMKTLINDRDHFLNTYSVAGTVPALYKHLFIELHWIFIITLQSRYWHHPPFPKSTCRKSFSRGVGEPGLKTKQPGSRPHAFNHSPLLPPQTQKGYGISKHLTTTNPNVPSRQIPKQRETVKEYSNAFFFL